MKICVIGNSHVGAIKRGWLSLSNQYPDIEIVFFASRSTTMGDLLVSTDNQNLYADNEKLKKTLEFTSGGYEEISVDDYDLFLVYGLQCKSLLIDPAVFYTQSFLTALIEAHVVKTLSFSTIKKLRMLTNKKIFVGHNPLFSINRGEKRKAVSQSYLNGCYIMNSLFYSTINCKIISQPGQTIVNGIYTDSIFSENSRRLSVGEINDNEKHSLDDLGHMNDYFGEVWLKSFLEQLKD